MVSPRERTFLERLESRRATRQPPRTRARRTSQATDSLPRTPAVEVFRRTHLDALELDPKCLGADLDGPNVEREERIVRVHEMPQASCLRRDFLEQLQSLRDGFGLTSNDNPVMLPPGRARLVTSPASRGPATPTKTMGIVVVTFAAVKLACVPPVTMTSTLSRASSAGLPPVATRRPRSSPRGSRARAGLARPGTIAGA